MIAHATPLAGLLRIEIEPHHDERGFFARLYGSREFAQAGIPFASHDVNLSRSRERYTLRGLHYQEAPFAEAKLVRVVRGRVYDVAVDLRPASPTWRQWFGMELCAERHEALLIPEGFAHGFMTLEPDTDFLYQMSCPFTPGQGRGIRFDDPAIGVIWPAPPAVMSDADRNWPYLERVMVSPPPTVA